MCKSLIKWTILAAPMVFGAQALKAASPSHIVVCSAEGRSLSNNSWGLLHAKALLSFEDSYDANGVRTLKNFMGTVVTSPEGSGDEASTYVGRFSIYEKKENTAYRPGTYKGFSQFRGVNAADSVGSREQGMWGEFILAKDTDPTGFPAHYIFQAGDHMGGTLHLSCTRLAR